MAGSSLLNNTDQITTLLVSHFVPGKLDKLKNLPDRCVLCHKIIEIIARKKMRTIRPYQTVNYDFTSTFFWMQLIM